VNNETNRRGHSAIKIDGASFNVADPMPTGRDLLELANRLPADEHVLFFRQKDGLLEDINLSEHIDIAGKGIEEFMSAKADRLFFLTVDGRRFPWSADTITGTEIRALALIPETKDIFYDSKGGKDDLIDEDEDVSLRGKEVEHFYTEDRSTEPRMVKVDLNGETVEILAGDYTTETLKQALGVTADLDLDVVDKNGSFRTLKPGEPIRVKAKMKFVSHVRQGGSS